MVEEQLYNHNPEKASSGNTQCLEFSGPGELVWYGKIDDIRIYNYILADAIIDSLYHEEGWDQLIADFSADSTQGIAPLTVQFTDLSIGNPISWQWDFENDGTIDSYDQNPNWIYNEVGTYTVSLTVSDGTDEDTEIKEDYITVYEVGEEWCFIPAGEYTYGEGDTIKTIDYDYQIMKYEVTNQQYVIYLEEAYTTRDIWIDGGDVVGYYEGDEHYPAGNYDFYDL